MSAVTEDTFNPFRSIAEALTPEKAARMALRHDAFTSRKIPLLVDAGLVPACDPADYVRSACYQADAWDRTQTHFAKFARLTRIFVGRRVGPEELARLDAYRVRSGIPMKLAYTADFWRRRLGDLCGRDARYQKCRSEGTRNE